jgi:hypothetical protein
VGGLNEQSGKKMRVAELVARTVLPLPPHSQTLSDE